MKELNCESVLIAQMAKADGETSTFSSEELESHIASCPNCRLELEQMKALNVMLMGQTLLTRDVDLWPSIEDRIRPRTDSVISWRPFALIGLLLVASKLLEMLPERDLGFTIKVVPLIIVTLLFVLIKENPFRINSDLVLEK
jgi:predicted anti-sigma-YlaC factor YlaD